MRSVPLKYVLFDFRIPLDYSKGRIIFLDEHGNKTSVTCENLSVCNPGSDQIIFDTDGGRRVTAWLWSEHERVLSYQDEEDAIDDETRELYYPPIPDPEEVMSDHDPKGLD